MAGEKQVKVSDKTKKMLAESIDPFKIIVLVCFYSLQEYLVGIFCKSLSGEINKIIPKGDNDVQKFPFIDYDCKLSFLVIKI